MFFSLFIYFFYQSFGKFPLLSTLCQFISIFLPGILFLFLNLYLSVLTSPLSTFSLSLKEEYLQFTFVRKQYLLHLRPKLKFEFHSNCTRRAQFVDPIIWFVILNQIEECFSA